MKKTNDPHKHSLPGGFGIVWQSATRKTFGGYPIRIGDRAFLRPADVEEQDLHAPCLVECVDIATEEDEPIWRELHCNPRSERAHDPDAVKFVPTIGELAPGTWTRIP